MDFGGTRRGSIRRAVAGCVRNPWIDHPKHCARYSRDRVARNRELDRRIGCQQYYYNFLGIGDVRVYFVLLLLNIGLAWEGITSIKWFDSIAAGVIIVLLAYTVYVVVNTQGIASESLNYIGTWGMAFLTKDRLVR